jgi:hypothetical protein
MSFTKPIGVAFTDQDLDDATLGAAPSAGGKIGFYGATPVTQRAAAVQAASVVSASSYITVGSNLAAWAAEVNATLTGLGLWKGAA